MSLPTLFLGKKLLTTRSSWVNCALRDDEAVYWVSKGHYEAVAVGNWWYWVSRGHLCLYILHKVEIWTGVTDAWLTDSQTLKDRATHTQLLMKYKSGALVFVTQFRFINVSDFLSPSSELWSWSNNKNKIDETVQGMKRESTNNNWNSTPRLSQQNKIKHSKSNTI